ncbi:MAG: 8-oxoguanine deaminase [Candidatus Roseilinea sp.]|nr:MAG: 8-oxoguanine deaminase [Candidatus Roseilinea sp.]
MKLISAAFGLPHAFAELQADFAICVDGNRIVAAGARDDLRAQYPLADHEHFDCALMLPGLVNSHDHGRGLGTASLGIPDDDLETWLLWLSAQPHIEPYLAAAYDGVRLLRAGVTATAHSHNPRDWRNMAKEATATLRGYRDAGIRVAFHAPIVDQNLLVYAVSQDEEENFITRLPAELRAMAHTMSKPALSHDEYFALCDRLFERYHDAAHHMAHIQVSPAGGQWCSDALISRAVEWACARDTRVQMHMLETQPQRDYAFRKWGKSFIRHLDDIGALGPWLTLAHMVWVEPEDLSLLAERSVAIIHNPSSNLRLRSGIAPLAAMLAAGVTVGIGLDGHALDDDQDYLREMRLAWMLSNLWAGLSATRFDRQVASVEARRVLHLGSRGGAIVTFGANVALGTLAVGNLADFVLLDLDFVPHDGRSPADDWIVCLLHLATRQHVRCVMADGEWVVRDGCATRLDEAALRAEIAASIRASDRSWGCDPHQLQHLAAHIRQFNQKHRLRN